MARARKGKSADAAKSEDTQPDETVSTGADSIEGSQDTAEDTVSGAEDRSAPLVDENSVERDRSIAADPETPAESQPDESVTATEAVHEPDEDSVAPDAMTGADSMVSDTHEEGAVSERAEDMDGGSPALAAESTEDRIDDDSALASVVPQTVRETVVERKGGFVPMVLGGVVAAVLGYGAAAFTDIRLPFLPEPAADPLVEQTQVALNQQDDRLVALETQMGETRNAIEAIDLQPVTSALAGVEDDLAQTRDAVAALEDRIAGFESRVTAVEKQPLAEAVSPEAIAAYERELEDLRGAIQQQRDAVEAQSVEVERMARDAVAAEQNAEDQAQLAEVRNALAEVTALVQEGRPFAEPLSIVQAGGVEVPQALTAPDEDGVATLAALAAEFPDVSRDALRAARTSSTAEEGGGGFSTFLQNQLGARSVQPRDGDDPDAVLSRAEAAVKSGDLEAALAEVAQLPQEAQAVMADWVARAEARRGALAAASDLARQINQE